MYTYLNLKMIEEQKRNIMKKTKEKMDVLTLREKYKLYISRRSMGTNCGVLDKGIYYLVAIVLKDLLKADVININGKKRCFLEDMFMATNGNTVYRFLLQNIIEKSIYLFKWKKWVRFFIHEYQRNVDVIIESECKHADDIIRYYPELLDCVRGVDEEEEYIDKVQLSKTFNISEMIPAVQRFVSQSQEGAEKIYSSQTCSEEILEEDSYG